ncbi:DNA damage-repair/toleration protein DRT100, partial [Linum perenne]
LPRYPSFPQRPRPNRKQPHRPPPLRHRPPPPPHRSQLADNQITGRIPSSFTNLSGLMHLDLRNNRFYGPILADFGRLRMLSRALLSRNYLSGSIPNSVSKIYRLADLDLSLNRLTGRILVSLGKMVVLVTLNLEEHDLQKYTGGSP